MGSLTTLWECGLRPSIISCSFFSDHDFPIEWTSLFTQRGRGRGHKIPPDSRRSIGTRIERTGTILVIGQHQSIFSCLLFGTSVRSRLTVYIQTGWNIFGREPPITVYRRKKRKFGSLLPLHRAKRIWRLWGRHSCSKCGSSHVDAWGEGRAWEREKERGQEIEPSQIRNIFDKFQR